MKEKTNQTENEQEDFSQMLEDFEFKIPKRGEVLKGEILSIEEDGILIDVGLKRDAVVPAKELSQTDEDLLKSLSVGDKIPVYVIQPGSGNDELWVSLQRAVEGKNWDDAKEDLEKETLLEVEVTSQNRGGLLVKYKQIEGFIPNSHIPGLQRDMDPGQIRSSKTEWIGKKIPVKTIEVDQQRRKLVFSAIHAQEERRHKRLMELKLSERQVITGEVVNVVDFGIFVDLDGVDGLVHVSELDWGRVENPSELFSPGDEIQVEILEVDVDRERVTLSRKNLMPNPWKILEDRYNPGDVIQSEIVQIMDFGAFVQLPEGVQGLIPKNELGYTYTDIPQESVKPGDMVLAKILSIEAKEGRMALSMRQVPRERQIEWLLSEDSGLMMAEDAEAPAEAEDAASEATAAAPEPEAEAQVEAEDAATEETAAATAAAPEAEAEAQAEATAAAPEAEAEAPSEMDDSSDSPPEESEDEPDPDEQR